MASSSRISWGLPNIIYPFRDWGLKGSILVQAFPLVGAFGYALCMLPHKHSCLAYLIPTGARMTDVPLLFSWLKRWESYGHVHLRLRCYREPKESQEHIVMKPSLST